MGEIPICLCVEKEAPTHEQEGCYEHCIHEIVMVTSSIRVKEIECDEQILVEVVKLDFGEQEKGHDH